MVTTQCGRTLITRTPCPWCHASGGGCIHQGWGRTPDIVIRVWKVNGGHVVTQNGVIVWGPSGAGEGAALDASGLYAREPVAPDVLARLQQENAV